MEIPNQLRDVEIECGECPWGPEKNDLKPYKSTPDMMMGHLVEQHGYKAQEAQERALQWVEDGYEYDQDEDVYLAKCPDHGPFAAPGPCPGCEEVERKVDEAIERSHAHDL